jgi:phosphoenolpyruvate-protein phosphotransferase/dihydroxyacetone kinase phosphotransfer subunit
MVGIVLVSHSRALATALVDLVRQVSGADVAIAISGGVGDDRSEFGTDAIELMDAIQEVDSPDGVLVLMDLGSAVLSAETALDLLPPEVSAHVRLCAAPIVEGAIAAAVQAGLGSDLDTVCKEATSALAPKREQIGVQAAENGETSSSFPESANLAVSEGEVKEIHLVMRNLHGLHARPAARFVKTAAGFDADIRVSNLTTGKGPVTAKSLNAVATLGAVKDHEIVIVARGPQAEEALETLSKMVEDGFGEMEEAEQPLETLAQTRILTGQAAPGELRGVPISEGVALGPFYPYQPPVPEITLVQISDPQAEWNRFEEALRVTQANIRQRQSQLTPTLGVAQAAIFEAHQLILEDPEILQAVHEKIFSDNLNAAAAWQQAIMQTADNYRGLEDAYLKQRAADVLDVGNQVLFALAGKSERQRIELPEPVILFAEELTPTETSQLDMHMVLGLITISGGPTSHSAILARALGIPAVSGVTPDLQAVEPGTQVGLDGAQGVVWLQPTVEKQRQLQDERRDWLAERTRLLSTSREFAVTRDGQRVEVVANVGNVLDAQTAAENGAEGIGLLRTEFLFLTRTDPPTEEDQFQALCQVGEALTRGGMNNLPIIVRTLDVGGDKELPYLQLAPEANPFLGVRALRLSLRKPDLFLPQVRAILRAGAWYNLRMMFPMVANLDEVIQARKIIEKAHQDLLDEGIDHCWPVPTGIMVEIPSAAILSPVIAPQVDFFSIGTNDLTQYTLAAERGNPQLANLSDALHPAILTLIHQVAQASHDAGKWTGVCGELAGDPLAAPVLVGLGVDELSMTPGSIPKVKRILRAVSITQMQELAQNVLAVDGAPAARQIAQAFYNEFIFPTL